MAVIKFDSMARRYVDGLFARPPIVKKPYGSMRMNGA